MESHIRSVIKAISWRCGGTVVTFAITLLISGEIGIATKVGIIDTIVKILAFYLHERIWHRINFGKIKRPEYEI